MFNQIFFGFIGIIFGITMMVYAHRIVDNFTGHIGLVEKYLGGGSTFTFIRYSGAIIAIVSMLIMFGLVGSVYQDIMSTLKGIAGG